MWISARTAITMATAALLLVVFAVAAPLLPRPKLPSLPEERGLAMKLPDSADKFGLATTIFKAPERVRAQRMSACDPSTAVEGGARLVATGRYGFGLAIEPSKESVRRLVALLKDARTVPDVRAANAEPGWVVRLVRDERKVDVMVDTARDRLVIAVDGEPTGSFGIVGLHREFAALGEAIFQ